ncbi:MAG: RdgB/HAM1 family non-canonical purine NTP pyrophosphatase [Paludibacteraceae bacterium]|nr:RdgB/HAM1 family non-canonical purine NTP pyrophosphatase [Paludibacteraceae bacterium]
MKLVFATNNAHKLDEVRRILPQEVEVLSLEQVGFLHDIDETGTTLAENSRIKAEAVAKFLVESGKWKEEGPDGVFADDTGLEIEALGGKPGVYTARWAGEPAANRRKALQELADKPNRAAQFRTVVTLIDRTGTRQVDGIVRGRIATEERGDGGFGYDPVFIPEGYDRTFAELPAEIKNTISHRARAMSELKKLLQLS